MQFKIFRCLKKCLIYYFSVIKQKQNQQTQKNKSTIYICRHTLHHLNIHLPARRQTDEHKTTYTLWHDTPPTTEREWKPINASHLPLSVLKKYSNFMNVRTFFRLSYKNHNSALRDLWFSLYFVSNSIWYLDLVLTRRDDGTYVVRVLWSKRTVDHIKNYKAATSIAVIDELKGLQWLVKWFSKFQF